MVVIGAGRVGIALRDAAVESEEPCHLIDRSRGWEALDDPAGAPILVATRNDALDEILSRVPPHRHGDLVFVQNGMIRPWLERHRLTEITQGLLYFAVPAVGDAPQPGPQPSPFTGPHSLAMVRWFTRLGVPAVPVDWPRFLALQLEKLIWNCAFGVLCQALDADVGTVCREHRAELTTVVDDLRQVGRASMNVDLPLEWLVDRLVAYSLTIPTYRAAVKEWSWRDGWFVAEAQRRGFEHAAHLRWLREAGESV
ncbi:MAG: hypothetical protein EA397_04765 [Deltaproteobacteria bacterium]|nr:MAG: hypothetical protein EA397_04765 [Deltaproteobacteria bacterium]